MITMSNRMAVDIVNGIQEAVDASLDLDDMTDTDFAIACDTLRAYADASKYIRCNAIKRIVSILERSRAALQLHKARIDPAAPSARAEYDADGDLVFTCPHCNRPAVVGEGATECPLCGGKVNLE